MYAFTSDFHISHGLDHEIHNPPRGIQWTLTSKLEDLDFADDVSVLSYQFIHVQQKTESLQKIGLEINIDKTKSLHLYSQQHTLFSLDGKNIEDINSFTDLGSIVNKRGGHRSKNWEGHASVYHTLTHMEK